MQSRTKRAPGASTRVDTTAVGAAGNGIPAEVYETAREAFIQSGTAKAVREATGLGHDATARLIDSGVPTLGLPSLREAARIHAAKVTKELERREAATGKERAEVLASALEERTAVAKRARASQAKVLGDVEESRAEEVRLVRLNRHSAIVLAQTNASLLKVSHDLAASLLEDLPKLRKQDPRQRMGILRTVAGVVHRTAQASQVAVHMEQLLLGKPTSILGHASGDDITKDMTPEQAEQWLDLANRAFARRARRLQPIEAEPADAEEAAETEAVDELVEDLEPDPSGGRGARA